MDTLAILVTGMSCEHCASAVRAEVGGLPGVTAVDVDVAAGKVVVTGQPLPGRDALRDAIAEAGYELAGWRFHDREGFCPQSGDKILRDHEIPGRVP